MELIVDNSNSARFAILKTLEGMNGKECSIFHAISGVQDLNKANKAFDQLLREGIIQVREYNVPLFGNPIYSEQKLTYVRLSLDYIWSQRFPDKSALRSIRS